MRYSLIFVALLSISSLYAVETAQEMDEQSYEMGSNPTTLQDQYIEETNQQNDSTETLLSQEAPIVVSVTGQGVAPMNTQSPAQAYALAKRAAIADAYRLIAEKIKGVRVEGQDVVKNMMVKRSTVRTAVHAMVKNANVVETIFKEGLCEVEMEIKLSHSQFPQ